MVSRLPLHRLVMATVYATATHGRGWDPPIAVLSTVLEVRDQSHGNSCVHAQLRTYTAVLFTGVETHTVERTRLLAHLHDFN